MSIPRQSVTLLALADLVPHPSNVREELTEIEPLARSIVAQGVIAPLAVTEHPKLPGKFTILAGHRRHAAATLARLEKVPCVIRHNVASETDHIALMLVENMQRSNLDPVEKAEAFASLANRGMSQTEIARMVGVKVPTVNYYLSLLDLDDESLEALRNGDLRVSHARATVLQQRKKARRKRGAPLAGRPVQVDPPHFAKKHPLAGLVSEQCDHSTRQKVGGVGCGQCWESIIRDDALGLIDHGDLPDLAAPGKQVDEVAVRRLVDGERGYRGTKAERDEAIRVLHARGLSDAQIAERMNLSDRTVLRRRQALGLETTWDGHRSA